MEAGEELNSIVRVEREVEIIGSPIQIRISVNLPKDEAWFWVEFDCWGHSCGTLFTDLKEALHWCVTCYSYNLNRPMRIKDDKGNEVFAPHDLEKYMRDHA